MSKKIGVSYALASSLSERVVVSAVKVDNGSAGMQSTFLHRSREVFDLFAAKRECFPFHEMLDPAPAGLKMIPQ